MAAFTRMRDDSPGHVAITAKRCDPDGSGYIRFTATGPATGPYPGNFHAAGQATFGPGDVIPPGVVSGTLLRVDEAFSIDSPVGRVAGVKRLIPTDRTSYCEHYPERQRVSFDAIVAYDAVIRTRSGTFRDRGRGLVTVLDVTAGPPQQRLFDQCFQQAFIQDDGRPRQPIH